MTDRALQVWGLLSDMSDKIIEESIILTETVPTTVKRRREKGRFSAFMNHPAMVAVLCAVVSLGVVVAIVLAGRGEPFTPPVVGTPHVEETVTQEPTDSEPIPIPADFASYESIIRMYSKLVEVLPDWVSDDKQEEIDALFYFPNEQAREWYNKVGVSAFILCPGDRANGLAHLGYAIKDVNGDGVEELFLLSDEFTMIALFTQYDGKPILLEDFWQRKKGFVNESGQIIISGSSGADVSSQEVYRLDAATGRLVLEEAIGLDGHTEDLQTIYYHQIGEDRTYISEEVYNAIQDQPPYAGIGQEKSREVLGQDYVPLLPIGDFEIGMTFEQVCEVLENSRIPYVYCLQRFFISQEENECLVLTMDPMGPFVVKGMCIYEDKRPTNDDIYAVRSGMSIEAVMTLLGKPQGDLASGSLTTTYETIEGDEYWIYWTQSDGSFSVEDIRQLPGEDDVFWVGMTVHEINEVVRAERMTVLNDTFYYHDLILEPFVLCRSTDGKVFLLDTLYPYSEGTSTTIKGVHCFEDRVPSDDDLAKLPLDSLITMRELIGLVGAPVECEFKEQREYSGPAGYYIWYTLSYQTTEGSTYEISLYANYLSNVFSGFTIGDVKAV